MMNKVFGGKTIQAKIMKFNFMIICIISIFLSVSAYLIANKKAVEITEHAMLHHVDTIAYQYKIAYDEMMGVVLNCAERGKFELEHLNSDSPTSVKSAALGDAKLLNDYCAIVGYGSYITKLSVFSENGALIQAGNSVGSANDAEKIMKSTWFQKELEKEIDTYRLDKEVSPFYNDANAILPIVRKISVNAEKEKAWVVLCISDKLYKNILTEASNENEAFVVTHIGTRIASTHEKPEYKEENEKLAERLAHEKEKSGILSLQLHGERTMVAYHREESSGIMTVESMPYRKLSNDILLLLSRLY